MTEPRGISPVTYPAPDDQRVLALYVPRGFWSRGMSHGAGPASLTPRDWPLQLALISRPAGTLSPPHYHLPTGPVQLPTRHQVMVCLSGRGRVRVYTCSGQYVGAAELQSGDSIVLTEGHAVGYLEPKTVFVEVKQGPGVGPGVEEKIPIPESGTRQMEA